jgi:hypothetical protein
MQNLNHEEERMKRAVNLVGLMVVFLPLNGFSATLYTEDFNVATGSYVPANPQSEYFHNWYVSEANTWWWPTTCVHTNYSSGTQWINRNLQHDILAANEYIQNPSVSAEMSNTWGGTSDALKFFFALLDARGNGYVGETTRSSRLAIYRVDNGVTGTWTLLGSNATGIAGNGRTVTLAVNNGTITLTNSLGGSLSVSNETTYTDFTRLAFSGYFTAGEVVLLDNVNVEGTVVALSFYEDFNGGVNNFVPTNLDWDFRWWFVSDANSWWWASTCVHTNYLSGTQWINRNLRDDVLAVDETFKNPSVCADMSMTWGSDGTDTLKYYVALLDENGNGYIGETTRGSGLAIYRVDNGVTGSWTLLGNNTSATAGNSRTVILSVKNGTITLTNSLGGSLCVSSEGIYTDFTQLAFSGYFTAGEVILVDNVNMKGTITASCYTEKFNTAKGAYVPTTAQSDFNYWSVSDANSWWWASTCVHTNYSSGIKWINRNLRDNVTAADESIENPSVSAVHQKNSVLLII